VNSDPGVASNNIIRDEIADLYESYKRAIFNYCAYRLFRRIDLAEDATSDVFIRFVEKYPSMREGELTTRNRIKYRNWLYGTASNVVNAMLRDMYRSKEIAAVLTREKEKILFAGSDESDQKDYSPLYQAIAQLNFDDQEIVTLRYFEELRTLEIAEITGKQHTAVRVRLSRVMKKLKHTIGDSFAELFRKLR
jgi:RNA polymerase sigma factor (sigma-70 family)